MQAGSLPQSLWKPGPGASELLKSQSKPGVSSCTSGIYSLTSAAMVMTTSLTRSSSGSTMGKGFDFCYFFPYPQFKADI